MKFTKNDGNKVIYTPLKSPSPYVDVSSVDIKLQLPANRPDQISHLIRSRTQTHISIDFLELRLQLLHLKQGVQFKLYMKVGILNTACAFEAVCWLRSKGWRSTYSDRISDNIAVLWEL